MTGCGTTTFNELADGRMDVPGVTVELAQTNAAAFRARVTWIKLPTFTLATFEQAAPHVGLLSTKQELTSVCFPLSGEAVWNGVRLRRGAFVVLGAGLQLHQVAESNTRWGLIAFRLPDFATYGRTLLGHELAASEGGYALCLPDATAARLLNPHEKACRVVFAKPDVMAHQEVGRSLEEEIVPLLVNLLDRAGETGRLQIDWRAVEAMTRLHEVAVDCDHSMRLSAVTATIGISERTLRAYCKALTGFGPAAYLELQRLNKARVAIVSKSRGREEIASIARRHGFARPERFAVAYQELFGKAPFVTPVRHRAENA